MKDRRRLYALVLCAAMLSLIFVSSVLPIAEAGHDCAGEDCPVCAALASAGRLLRGLSLLGLLLIALFAQAAFARRFARAGRRLLPPRTPVALHVQLNN